LWAFLKDAHDFESFKIHGFTSLLSKINYDVVFSLGRFTGLSAQRLLDPRFSAGNQTRRNFHLPR
jgi:hypothetical protein